MLFVTVCFTAAMVNDAFGDSKELVMSMPLLYYFSIFMVIGTMIAIVCFYKTLVLLLSEHLLLSLHPIPIGSLIFGMFGL